LWMVPEPYIEVELISLVEGSYQQDKCGWLSILGAFRS